MATYLPIFLLFGPSKSNAGVLTCVSPEAAGCAGAAIAHTGCAEWQMQSLADPACLEVSSRRPGQLLGAAQAQDLPSVTFNPWGHWESRS